MAIVHDVVGLFWIGLLVVAAGLLLGNELVLKAGVVFAAIGLIGTAVLSAIEYYVDRPQQGASAKK